MPDLRGYIPRLNISQRHQPETQIQVRVEEDEQGAWVQMIIPLSGGEVTVDLGAEASDDLRRDLLESTEQALSKTYDTGGPTDD